MGTERVEDEGGRHRETRLSWNQRGGRRETEVRTSLLAVSATAVATLATAVAALATAVSATESTTATASALVGNVDTDATAVCRVLAKPVSTSASWTTRARWGKDIPCLMQIRAS